MQCRKCKKDIPDGSTYCCHCGVRQQPPPQRPKSRGNGQGSVYQRGRTWMAVVVTGYYTGADGKLHKRTRSKGGFATKRDAVAYLPALASAPRERRKITLQEAYNRWEPTHRADASTVGCYRAAFRYFEPLWSCKLPDIDIDDLQDCVDACPRGRRTKENMKAAIGLIYKYAIPRGLASLNLGPYLILSGEHGSKDGLPLPAVDLLRAAIGRVPYADYIVAQCYLGYRPSELLALRASDYDPARRAFVAGAKTDAGKDRTVTVSPKIQPIIDRLMPAGDGYVFAAPNGGQMPIKSYREAFYAALETVGIDNPVTERDGVKYHKYTPHSCRHTFATLLKGVKAPDKDKLELIGHTSTEMLRHYQDVDIDALRRITDAL